VLYTEQLRPHDCGVVALGDPKVALFFEGGANQRLPKGFSSAVFTCPGSCTEKLFPNGATIFASALHQHENGKRIWTDQSRGGSVTNMARNDFYDSGFQLLTRVNGTVNPGDSFSTTCINYAHDDGLRWGLGSRDEMCINYVYYWPKVYDSSYCGYRTCGSMEPVQALTDDKPPGFGTPASTCQVDATTSSRNTTSRSIVFVKVDRARTIQSVSAFIVVGLVATMMI